jgi:cytochrome P450
MVLRWLGYHALVRLAASRLSRAGDLQARLLLDPCLREDPFPVHAQLRAKGSLVATSLMHVTASHDMASAVLRSDAFGVAPDPNAISRPMRTFMRHIRRSGAVGPLDPPSLLAIDPPDHTRYRRLVARVFTARSMESMRGRVTEIADDLLDRLDGEADLVSRYASLLPVTVIAEILGVPAPMRERFVAWARGAAAALEIGLSWREFRRSERALQQLNEWLRGQVASRRRSLSPPGDLLSQLIQLDELTERDVLATGSLLLLAGFETTVNLISSGVLLLINHPQQRARLAADPAGWPNAVEEMLRFESPVQFTARQALRDVQLADHTIRQGTWISVLIGGANRDPAVFAEPDRFDITRANARDHLAFSMGAHYCIGAALARIEGEIGLRRLFERFPDLTLTGAPVRRPTRTLRGYDELPVRLAAPAGIHHG